MITKDTQILTVAKMQYVCEGLLKVVGISRSFMVDGIITGSTEREVKDAITEKCQELHNAHHQLASSLCEMRGMTEQCNILNHCEAVFCDGISNIVGEHVC